MKLCKHIAMLVLELVAFGILLFVTSSEGRGLPQAASGPLPFRPPC